MTITDLRLTGLAGGTVEGGWAEELVPDDNIHTVVEVLTDDGLVGVGSAMTSLALVDAAAKLLRPFLIGERADEPARVSEKLRQHTFWQGRGGAVEHAISGIDIALWDLFGKVVNQPVARLLGDAYWPHGYKWALRTAQMLSAYDVVWFEEALPPDDLAGYVELRRQSPVPIATGEVLTRRQSFWPFLRQHAVDIIQPDCTKCGGLTEAWRIGWMAYEHNIQLVPHGWNTALGLATDLHLTAALPIARYVEFLTPSPYIDRLITTPLRPDSEGYLHLPTGPGLGVELDGEALKEFA